MKLTDEQRSAIHHDGNAVVVACPGSGKTRAIIARLLRSVDAVRDTPRRVACITYTNTAVHEIENRIRTYGGAGDDEYCDVSTIHSFCQHNILRHFHWKFDRFKDGVKVLPSDCDEFQAIVEDIGDKYELDFFARQQFESLNRKPNGDPITSLPHEAAIEFWDRLEAEGCVDFCNLVYYSYQLLSENPSIVQGLAARYAFMLVDEFQDTSALQVQLLSLIAGVGITTFFLVGDPEQSIYRFAGAERELMFEFAEEIDAHEFTLSGNFRSSAPVVECAEALIPRDPTMFSAGDAALFAEEPVHEHVENHFIGITDFFLPALEALNIPYGDAAILAPVWYQLMPLGKELRNYGVPVVGPGARPYRKSTHLFAGIAEKVCAYADNPQSVSIRQVERELFVLLQNVTGRADFRVFAFDGRRAVTRILRQAAAIREEHIGAVEWLNVAGEAFAEILHEESFLPKHCVPLLAESAVDIVRDIERQSDVDVANLTTTDLGMFANPAENLKLLTMHGAKGREFSAVAVIGLHDGRVPYHNHYNPLTPEGLEESRRLTYVAVTRAKRFLALFTDDDDFRPVSRFLDEMGFDA